MISKSLKLMLAPWILVLVSPARAETYPRTFTDSSGVTHRVDQKKGGFFFGSTTYVESFEANGHRFQIEYDSEESLQNRWFDRIDEIGQSISYFRDRDVAKDVVSVTRDANGREVRQLEIFLRDLGMRSELKKFIDLAEAERVQSWPNFFPILFETEASVRENVVGLKARDIQWAFYEASLRGSTKSLEFLVENEKPGKDTTSWIWPLDKRPVLSAQGYRLNVDAHPYGGYQIPYPPYKVGTPLLDALESPVGFISTEARRFETAKFLLENGADVNALSSSGNTALNLVVDGAFGADKDPQFIKSRKAFVKLLFDHGYNVKLRGSDTLWKAPLVEIIESCKLTRELQEDLVDELLERGADPNETGFMNRSARNAKPCQSKPASERFDVRKFFAKRLGKSDRKIANEIDDSDSVIVPTKDTITIELPGRAKR